MSYVNVRNRLGNYRHKAGGVVSSREKFMEALKPWVCCSRPRNSNKRYFDLEKSADSSVAYSISNPIAVEVNGKAGDIGQPRIASVQELPASPVPKRLDGSFDPKLPALSMNLYDSNHERRRTFDFFHYQPPSQTRITQIIDSYGDYGNGGNGKTNGTHVPTRSPTVIKIGDDRLRGEIEFIRAASRKYPENTDLSAAADATYLVDEKGEPRPEMIEAIDRVLGGPARERKYFSGSTEMSNYSNMSNLIQPLQPKPARCRDSDQPRQLLRSMDERKQLEQRLLNIQRALTQRKKDKNEGNKDSLMVPPQAHGGNGAHASQHITGELIDELIDDFYDDDCPQVTQDTVSMLPNPPAPSAQLPHRAPTLTAMNRRKTAFRHSNPFDDSRFSLNYSEYIYEEYGKPSPSEAVFSGEEDPCLMRSVSQRPVEPPPPPLRRTRSSETIAPRKALVLSRNDSMISAPGNRLDRWLSRQDEYFGADKPGPISNLPRLPQDTKDTKAPRNSVRLQPLRRNSIGTPGDFWPSARDIAGSPNGGFPNNENSSCVGIPYSAMLKKDPAVSVASANSSSTYHNASSVPPHQQHAISELEAIPSGTGKQRGMEALTDPAAIPPNRPTGFEAGRMV